MTISKCKDCHPGVFRQFTRRFRKRTSMTKREIMRAVYRRTSQDDDAFCNALTTVLTPPLQTGQVSMTRFFIHGGLNMEFAVTRYDWYVLGRAIVQMEQQTNKPLNEFTTDELHTLLQNETHQALLRVSKDIASSYYMELARDASNNLESKKNFYHVVSRAPGVMFLTVPSHIWEVHCHEAIVVLKNLDDTLVKHLLMSSTLIHLGLDNQ